MGKNRLLWTLSRGLIIEVQIPAMLLTDCVILGKSFYFSESQFLHLLNEDYASYLLVLVARMKWIMSLEYWAQHLAHSGSQVTTIPTPSGRNGEPSSWGVQVF